MALNKRVLKDVGEAVKNLYKEIGVYIAPEENNFHNVHFVLPGPEDTPYEGGLYHGMILLNNDHPLKPPNMYMFTPSGRFTPEAYPVKGSRGICTTSTSYHPDTWTPMNTIENILVAFMSLMVQKYDGGVGGMSSTDVQTRAYAKKSIDHLKNDPIIQELFPELYISLMENTYKPVKLAELSNNMNAAKVIEEAKSVVVEPKVKVEKIKSIEPELGTTAKEPCDDIFSEEAQPKKKPVLRKNELDFDDSFSIDENSTTDIDDFANEIKSTKIKKETKKNSKSKPKKTIESDIDSDFDSNSGFSSDEKRVVTKKPANKVSKKAIESDIDDVDDLDSDSGPEFFDNDSSESDIPKKTHVKSKKLLDSDSNSDSDSSLVKSNKPKAKSKTTKTMPKKKQVESEPPKKKSSKTLSKKKQISSESESDPEPPKKKPSKNTKVTSSKRKLESESESESESEVDDSPKRKPSKKPVTKQAPKKTVKKPVAKKSDSDSSPSESESESSPDIPRKPIVNKGKAKETPKKKAAPKKKTIVKKVSDSEDDSDSYSSDTSEEPIKKKPIKKPSKPSKSATKLASTKKKSK